MAFYKDKKRQWRVSREPECVSVTCFYPDQRTRPSTASASYMGDGEWFLNRCLVSKDDRRQGIGTKLLMILRADLVVRDDFERLIVTPGGYDTPPEIQRAFYEKCGFVATATDEDGVLEWR